LNALEESFTTLLGRQPSDKERQALLRTRDALNLKNNDALWLVFMALGHYETVYARFPALISRAATDVTERAKAAADAEIKAAAARVQGELAHSVAKTAHDIADRVASTQRSKWALTGVALGVAMVAGVGSWMYRQGVRSGNAAGQLDGYSRARDEKAAAAWANTPEGQLGYDLAKAGSLHELATCSGKAFMQRGSSCFVRAGRESVFGWKLFRSASDGR
jgi:hypothetical protein